MPRRHGGAERRTSCTSWRRAGTTRTLYRVLACSVGEAYNTYSFSQAFKQGGSAVRRAGGALLTPLSVAVVAVLGMVFNRTRARITGKTLFFGVLQQGHAGGKPGVLQEDDTKRSANSLNGLGSAVASPLIGGGTLQ